MTFWNCISFAVANCESFWVGDVGCEQLAWVKAFVALLHMHFCNDMPLVELMCSFTVMLCTVERRFFSADGPMSCGMKQLPEIVMKLLFCREGAGSFWCQSFLLEAKVTGETSCLQRHLCGV